MKFANWKRLIAAPMLILVLVLAAAGCTSDANNSKYTDTITVVWYPNESAADYDSARKHFEDLIAQATGKTVVEKLTTDYNIAIEALANGQAQIGAVMGALGFIQAQQKNANVLPLLVNSGASGTLDDAVYYSFIAVNKDDAANYMTNGAYAIDNIKGKRVSFVSNSSTSGFLFPATSIIAHFSSENLTEDALVEGGSDKFFSEVLFGGSHQGSAVNLLTGKADCATFCDTEIMNYATLVSGDGKSAGDVWRINDDASAPFDTVTGKEFVVLQSLPVQNGPSAYNGDTLSPEDVKAIQDLFTSDAVTNDEQMFVPEGSDAKGFYKQASSKRFIAVENSWYDTIRDMLSK